MLRDVGSLAQFGPDNLTQTDYNAIENADYVCIFNWAGTRYYGSALASKVFLHTKTSGRAKTYYDTADPGPNEAKIPELVNKVLRSKHLDILSLNENEALRYASQISDKAKELTEHLEFDEAAKEAARILAIHLHTRVDLHATGFSSTFNKSDEITVDAFKVPVLRATGAGDAWNAGNILGDAARLSNGARLLLANATAACYISDPNGKHPTRRRLAEFCRKKQRKRRNRDCLQHFS
jgi:ribokinase